MLPLPGRTRNTTLKRLLSLNEEAARNGAKIIVNPSWRFPVTRFPVKLKLPHKRSTFRALLQISFVN